MDPLINKILLGNLDLSLVRSLTPWSQLTRATQKRALERPKESLGLDYLAAVKPIIEKVRTDGDQALREFGTAFDGWQGSWIREPLGVPESLWFDALSAISSTQRAAIKRAIVQITRFHQAQKPRDFSLWVSPGLRCAREFKPIEAIGIYVPAGQAPLPSSLLMTAVPARLAGCKQIIACTPARPDGTVDPGILAAAALTGVTQLFRVGGAHAIAAMAYGTQEIPKVHKIFGPGNSYVTAAKAWCALDSGGAAADMPAGPSELMVVADETADPDFVAADLLSQAEHAADSHVVLVVLTPTILPKILAALNRQLPELATRERAAASLKHAAILWAEDSESCLEIINLYAPEHLILQISQAESLAMGVKHAGSIFLGHLTPESLGDYASGTNHVLPTSGMARSYSGLGLESFLKSTTLQRATPRGLRDLGPTVMELARMEGLEAHRTAVALRLAKMDSHELALATWQREETEQDPVLSLARPSVVQMVGYQSARGLKESQPGLCYLDANEAPFDPRDPAPTLTSGYNRYPEPQPKKLVERLAATYKVDPRHLLLTAGADQGIDLLVRAFCEASIDSIVTTPPTYGYYEVCASVQGCTTVKVPLIPIGGRDYALDRDGIKSAVAAGAKLVFICSPNNPTGMSFARHELVQLAQDLVGRAVLVVDEAYGEFSVSPTVTSIFTHALSAAPNLVVLRTLSKAYGLAGLRIGCVLGDPRTIDLLQKIRPPYPLSQASIETAIQVLGYEEAESRLARQVADCRRERELLVKGLLQSSLIKEIFPSETNFLLVRCRDKAAVLKKCAEGGLVIRDRSGEPGLEDCVRITVGSAQEVSRLWTQLLGQPAQMDCAQENQEPLARREKTSEATHA